MRDPKVYESIHLGTRAAIRELDAAKARVTKLEAENRQLRARVQDTFADGYSAGASAARAALAAVNAEKDG